MHNLIKKLCQRIEKEKNIRILFAVENGSRVWGMESKDSDYDVRFVFVRPLIDYIQIKKPEEVINLGFDKRGNKTRKNALIDMSGFDIFKYAQLLYHSNPTTIEWLMSDIVYHGKQNTVFKKFAIKNFNPLALYYHYKSSNKHHYLQYIKSKRNITYKRYLYAFRGLVNAKFVAYRKSVPPIRFSEALEGMEKIIPPDILARIETIIKLKSEGKEKKIIENLPEMDEYIEKFLGEKEVSEPRKRRNLDAVLNAELRKIVLGK